MCFRGSGTEGYVQLLSIMGTDWLLLMYLKSGTFFKYCLSSFVCLCDTVSHGIVAAITTTVKCRRTGLNKLTSGSVSLSSSLGGKSDFLLFACDDDPAD